MIRASGGQGSVPCLAEREQRGGCKGKIKNRGATGAAKEEMSVNPRLVEEAKAQLSHPGEVRKGGSKFFCGVGAEGIR